jgi:hypothetical protein
MALGTTSDLKVRLPMATLYTQGRRREISVGEGSLTPGVDDLGFSEPTKYAPNHKAQDLHAK